MLPAKEFAFSILPHEPIHGGKKKEKKLTDDRTCWFRSFFAMIFAMIYFSTLAFLKSFGFLMP